MPWNTINSKCKVTYLIIPLKDDNNIPFRLFKRHPELADAYGADGIDPDRLGASQKFVMYGSSELQYFFQLPNTFGEDRKWRSALSNFKEQYGDIDLSLKEFNVSCFLLMAI